MLLVGTSLLSSEKRNFLEIVEAVASPDGDLAQCVALIQLEIHVESNKLARTTNSEQKKDPTHRRLDMCFEWMPSYRWQEEIKIDFKSKSMPRYKRTNQCALYNNR